MKNDRELTELAAKAAGIVGKWSERGNCILISSVGMSDEWWRPLDDDGCATRLAVKLGFIFDIDTDEFCTTIDFTVNYDDMVILEGHCFDANKATRRAIVRAAAAIGESMQ